MSSLQGEKKLEIGNDPDFQRRSWTAQKISWVLLGLLLLAALLGLLGPGPLSSATAGNKNGSLWLEYDRFTRYLSPTTLRLHLGAGAISDGKARVVFGKDYLESIQVERVTPNPDSTETGLEGIVYTFQLSGPATISFDIRLEKVGPQTGQVGLAKAETLTFSQFVYP